jgi:hypothetical protein
MKNKIAGKEFKKTEKIFVIINVNEEKKAKKNKCNIGEFIKSKKGQSYDRPFYLLTH